MKLDRTTEGVAHFIGLFQIGAEEARMRQDYDAFRAARDQEDLAEAAAVQAAAIRAPYTLEPFDPKLREIGVAPEAPRQPSTDRGPQAPEPQAAPAPAARPAEAPALPSGPGAPSQAEPLPVLAPPNAIASVLHQSLRLSDDDVFGPAGTAPFLPPEALLEQVQDLVALAGRMGLPPMIDLAQGALPVQADALAMAARMAEAAAGAIAPPGGEVHVMLAAAPSKGEVAAQAAFATGYVDGVATGTLPEYDALLPARLRAPEEAEGRDAAPADGLADAVTAARAGTGAPGAAQPGPEAQGAEAQGLDLVTGENLSVNAVAISLRWIDAPVIAVGGNVTALTTISQTNLLMDRDTVNGAGDGSGASTAVNAATASLRAAGPAAEPAGGDGPAAAIGTRIDEDLFVVNWVQQYVFATDMDRVAITLSETAAYVGLGANGLSNLAAWTGLGYHYDLILVGGDMLTLTSVHQSNVLLDDDVVSGAPSATLATGDNLQFNRAEVATVGIDSAAPMTQAFRDATRELAEGAARDVSAAVAGDPLFDGAGLLQTLEVAGNLTKLTVVTQHNVLGDADQVHLALAGTVAALGQPATVSTGSNAQVNEVLIEDLGLDSLVMAGGEIYSDALIHQASLIDTGAPVPGAALPPLASEAVAFLAEGLIAPPPPLHLHDLPTMSDLPGATDPMQGVLA